MGPFELYTSLEMERNVVSVACANDGTTPGAIVDYETMRPRKIYNFTSNKGVDIDTALTWVSNLEGMMAAGGVANWTDSRGNSFSAPIWGIRKLERPNPGVIYYDVTFYTKDPPVGQLLT